MFMKLLSIRIWLGGLMVVIFTVGSGVILWNSKVPSPTPKTQAELDAAVSDGGNVTLNWFSEDEDEDEDEEAEEGDDDSGAVATPTVTSPNSGQPSYLFAEVQTHNTPSDCWGVVNGSVYDLTTWISRHPGGVSPIRGMCGTDGTEGYTGQHRNSKKIQSTLILFKIGTLQQ